MPICIDRIKTGCFLLLQAAPSVITVNDFCVVTEWIYDCIQNNLVYTADITAVPATDQEMKI